MTKCRAPLSIDAALTEIAAHLPGGLTEMAEITGRAPHLVRAWGDPDRREQIPLRDAILLDTAYRAAGGSAAPLFAYYTSRLDTAGALAPAGAAALLGQAATVIRECAEAQAALLQAAAPGAPRAASTTAGREIEEAIAALHAALPMLLGRQASDRILGKAAGHHRPHDSTGPPN